MKKYTEPTINLIVLRQSNVILSSPLAEIDPFGNDKDWVLPNV